ncbi:MAG: phosphoglycerate kinase [bacterium]|nr:phosphoglycerate kinase [bacterium]MBU1427418.1 phosphoglycerate kinase [bacterium]MBU2439932.1 phosphoglycerate kinase [bacterium]
MQKKTIKDLNKNQLEGKRVLVRVDFNVPLNEELEITDDTRIKAALSTIKYLMSHQAKVVLMSHLGRPKGKVVEKLRLDPVAKRLSELLEQEVKKLNDCIGEEVEKIVSNMQKGGVVLLENLRFHPEEEKNDYEFSKKLANLADIFVNDAFGTAHRAHASTFGVARMLPSYAGFLMAKEIEVLSNLIENPERPFVVVLGGAKISGKIEIVQNLLSIADRILIAGGMSYTCLAALGYEVGNSLLEEYDLEIVKKMLKKAKEKGNKILLPVDLVITKEASERTESKMVEIKDIPKDVIGVDLGDKSIAIFEKEIKKARTVFWNGPVGVFEIKKYAKGTNRIAKILADMQGKAVTIIGGGDSIAAIENAGLAEKMTHISTGGGASLEFLGGEKLPGIEVLPEK